MSNGSEEQVPAAGGNAPQPGPRLRTLEERRRLVTESLHVGNPANRARNLPDQADSRHDCLIELRVEDIRPYEHNPRRAINPRFAEIKESVRTTGIRNPLTVTRRPGETVFIVEAGGNTRLLAIQQLWTETRDPRFEKLTVMFRPWRSEAHVLTAHLIENDQRGDLSYWDKANGIAALKARLEEEKGRPLSLRQFGEELSLVGLSSDAPTVSRNLYVVARLRTLGEAVRVLSVMDVRLIQPRLNLIKRYAQMREGTGEAALYETVFEPVFQRFADDYRREGTFNALSLCVACEAAFAKHLGDSEEHLRMILDTLALSPQATLESLHGSPGLVPSSNSLREPGTPSGMAADKPDAGHAIRRSGHKPRSMKSGTAPDGPAVPDPLSAAIARLGQFGKVPDCIRRWDAAPLGYYVEVPAVPFGTDPEQQFAHRAWWLLAVVCRQFDDDVRRALPPTSPWQRVGPTDHCRDEGPSGSAPGKIPAAITLDAAFFDWLLDGRDEAADALWEVVRLARELRCRAPGIAISTGVRAPEKDR